MDIFAFRVRSRSERIWALGPTKAIILGEGIAGNTGFVWQSATAGVEIDGNPNERLDRYRRTANASRSKWGLFQPKRGPSNC